MSEKRLPFTAEELRVLRARHATARLMESGDTVIALIDDINCLYARFSREENEHAELQSRCFEGFPSVSDGIFDAYKAARNYHDALVAALEKYGSHPDTCRKWIHGSFGSVRAENVDCTCGLGAALRAAKGKA